MRFLNAKGLARAALLGGLMLAGAGAGSAQQALPAADKAPGTTITIVESEPAELSPATIGGATKKDEAIKDKVVTGETAILTNEVAAKPGTPVVVTEGAPAATCAADLSAGVDWTKVPLIEKMPRPGNFYFPPTGCGYYSLKDVIEGNLREKAPFSPYPPSAITANSSFNYDFRYLDKPDNTQHDFFDPIKRMHLGDSFMLGVGGEFRWRHMHEVDSRFTGRNNDYDLMRTRLDIDLYFKDRIRIYAEVLDARTFSQNLPPLRIDKNPLDVQNLFADIMLFKVSDEPVDVRIGRQELLYGSQRLVSPLDWANTRRTFQGVKTFWHSECLDVDAFLVQPVIVDPTRFDSVDNEQTFAGFWATYKPSKSQAIDLYYLYLNNSHGQRPFGIVTPSGGLAVNTIGARYFGDSHNVMWDFEGMYQFGEFSPGQDLSSGAFCSGIGYHFGELPMNPQIWLYNEWYSGDHNRNAGGTHGTFNQLFPFGHYYMGFLDTIGQQNIDDLHLNFAINPVKWITMTAEYHVFRLDSARDSLYNAAGAPILTDRTGRAGTDVGTEIDLTANIHLTQHQDIFVGYTHLYSGHFIKTTSRNNRSPELAYLMYAFKF